MSISDHLGTAQDLRKDGTWFRDSKDRYVLFRGVNLASRSKFPPYLPILSLDVKTLDKQKFEKELALLLPEFDRLQELGFNVVRLLVMWKAIEPVSNPNLDKLLPEGIRYLEYLKQIIDVLYKRGIFVILDFHQDLAHEIYGGEGFTDFAVADDKFTPLFPVDNKFTPWQLQYALNPSLQLTMLRFWLDYGDEHMPRTHLEKTIGSTARFFQSVNGKSGHPGIVGYELFNEPRSFLFSQSKFEEEILPQYYRNVITEIRRDVENNAGDKTSFIFVEPVIDSTVRSNSFDNTDVLKFFVPPESLLDLSKFSNERIVYSFHYYDPLLFIPGPKDMGDRQKQWTKIFAQLCEEARSRNAIPFLTEFGVDHKMKELSIDLESPSSDIVREVMDEQYKQVEENLLNATYWNYNFYNTQNEFDCWNDEDFSILGHGRKLREEDIVARPYPMRSSAMPTLLKFDVTTRHCVMMFSGIPADSPTLIYVPDTIHYKDGFEIYSSNQKDITYDKENHVLFWLPDKDSVAHQIILCPLGKFDEKSLPKELLKLYSPIEHCIMP